MNQSNSYRLLLLTAIILTFGDGVASADVILSLTPSSQSITVGSQGTVDLNISGLQDPPSLGTFDVNVNFDPTILSFSSVSFGDPVLGDQLDPTGLGLTITSTSPGTGTVELFDLSLDSADTLNTLQPPSFTLGVLSFNAIGPGTDSLGISINALGDAYGNSIPASVQNGAITVTSPTTVPEPSATWLLCSCFFAMVGLRRLIKRVGAPPISQSVPPHRA